MLLLPVSTVTWGVRRDGSLCCCSAAVCCGWHVAGSNYCGAGQGIAVHSAGYVWQGRASGDRMLGTGRCFSVPHVRCARLGDRCQEAWSAAAEPRRAGWRKTEENSECVLLVLQCLCTELSSSSPIDLRAGTAGFREPSRSGRYPA